MLFFGWILIFFDYFQFKFVGWFFFEFIGFWGGFDGKNFFSCGFEFVSGSGGVFLTFVEFDEVVDWVRLFDEAVLFMEFWEWICFFFYLVGFFLLSGGGSWFEF